MLAVDTNVLVRLLARDDARQAAAADAAVSKGAWVSQLVLAEAVWVLDAVYERTSRQLIAALDLLLAHESLVLQDADVVTAALAQSRASPAPKTPSALPARSWKKARTSYCRVRALTAFRSNRVWSKPTPPTSPRPSAAASSTK